MEIVEALTVPAIVLALVWATIEWVLPVSWLKSTRIEWALVLGVACVVALHFAAVDMLDAAMLPPAVAHIIKVCYWGPGLAGFVLAGVVGILAGGLTPLFHDQVINRFAPALKKRGPNEL